MENEELFNKFFTSVLSSIATFITFIIAVLLSKKRNDSISIKKSETSLKKLLLFDGNLKNDNDTYLYDINNIKKLQRIFINKFNVLSKLVSQKMFNENNKYNELQEIIKTQIYSILNNENVRVYFPSFEAAVKHLMQIQYLSITKKVIQENKTYKFKYKDKEFKTIEEVIAYCKKFIKSVEDYLKAKKGKKHE